MEAQLLVLRVEEITPVLLKRGGPECQVSRRLRGGEVTSMNRRRKETPMMTIVSRVRIKEGEEPAWDTAMRERVAAAREQPGFVAVQVGIPLDAPNERVIVGSWDTRADWEAWHDHERFAETRERLEEVDETRTRDWWHEVVLEEHR